MTTREMLVGASQMREIMRHLAQKRLELRGERWFDRIEPAGAQFLLRLMRGFASHAHMNAFSHTPDHERCGKLVSTFLALGFDTFLT